MTETPRGYIVLGASTAFGIEIKGIDTLNDCIKKCVTMGGGIAATNAMVDKNPPQICCNIDFDFATHRCYMHPCVNAKELEKFCKDANVQTPLNAVPNPSAVTITFCEYCPSFVIISPIPYIYTMI